MGCNLTCSFCDTPYTWDGARFDLAREGRSLEIAVILEQLNAKPLHRLVITGGEPLLQQRPLSRLIERLPLDLPIEVETNGTRAAEDALLSRVSQWNLSPKLASAALRTEQGVCPEVLLGFKRKGNAFLKFVIGGQTDLSEADALVESLAWPVSHVLLMPEARTRAALLERSEWLAAAALERGYRFSTRLHVLLWGDERGR